ncbi:hypothetical protein [Caenispirillum bisanense]|uniref:Uncharacterized protein n=1 Tax=Caenispirillum bisanense TaxID=414052 RepID=A0A286GTP5_9PROT|nr:hypothetical protein [Caenispirillum bisanense]SOD98921.1 hypothetical protein SAMN05421508_108142 [Caenispirillum bisanense]
MPPTTRRPPVIARHAAALLLLAALVQPAAAQEGAPSDPRTQALVEDLRRVIGDAEARDVPRDHLLQTLKGLVGRYDEPFAHVLVRDTFQDGTYTSDPAWRVLSGDWQAVAGSVVSPPTGPALTTPTQPPDDVEALRERIGAVTELVERLRKKDEPAPPPAPVQAPTTRPAPAAVALPVAIPQAFRVRLLVTLEDEPGAHAVALRLTDGDAKRDQGYGLAIESFGSRSRLVLSRDSGLGESTLASQTLPYTLAGGEVRDLVLERTVDGTFRVLLGEAPVLTAKDPRRAPDLRRLVLERTGGRLIVSLVEVRAAAVRP